MPFRVFDTFAARLVLCRRQLVPVAPRGSSSAPQPIWQFDRLCRAYGALIATEADTPDV